MSQNQTFTLTVDAETILMMLLLMQGSVEEKLVEANINRFKKEPEGAPHSYAAAVAYEASITALRCVLTRITRMTTQIQTALREMQGGIGAKEPTERDHAAWCDRIGMIRLMFETADSIYELARSNRVAADRAIQEHNARQTSSSPSAPAEPAA